MNISEMIDQHNKKVSQTINLVASENLLSDDVKAALSSDLAMRYAIPPENQRPEGLWDYPNQQFIRQIFAETEALARKALHASYVDVRPLSGNQIAQIILTSLVSPGDTVWSIPSRCGGHFTTRVIAAKRGLNLVSIPYDDAQGIISIDEVRELAKVHPPKLVFLDASMHVFPHPVSELRDVLGPEVIISYDASHTLGLISSGLFQKPLLEGADLVHGSTHKTFWGPQKGIIAARDISEISEKLDEIMVPFFVSNCHVHHVAALGVAFEELRDFGERYARDVISNAQILAANLFAEGIQVMFDQLGFTQSHQILIYLGTKNNAMEVWNNLQDVGIHSNAIKLPFNDHYGLRLGTAEATRRGMGSNEMKEIALIMSGVMKGEMRPASLKEEVSRLSQKFTHVHYTKNITAISFGKQ
jgi:glycine hydroxymethyltransferase